MNRLLTSVFGILVFVSCVEGIGRMQSVAIRGNLRCEGEPAAGIRVKLVDHNLLFSDDTLAFADSDMNGNFYLAGHRTEISTVQPEAKIYHSCDHFFEQCTKLRVPSDYVSSGQTATRVYDVGTLNLESGADSC